MFKKAVEMKTVDVCDIMDQLCNECDCIEYNVTHRQTLETPEEGIELCPAGEVGEGDLLIDGDTICCEQLKQYLSSI